MRDIRIVWPPHHHRKYCLSLTQAEKRIHTDIPNTFTHTHTHTQKDTQVHKHGFKHTYTRSELQTACTLSNLEFDLNEALTYLPVYRA